MNRRYYIIPIYGCTDPENLIGPYKSFKEMLPKAIEVKNKQREEDAIFWLVTEDNPTMPPAVFAFSNRDFE